MHCNCYGFTHLFCRPMMRFRLANSIYVYGIEKKAHFDDQVSYVGCYGASKTSTDRNLIPVRNYGIEPRNWDYEEYDPRHPWYQAEIHRILKTFPKKQRNVKYCYAWDILNWHAHTIQMFMKRFLAERKHPSGLQRQSTAWDFIDFEVCEAKFGRSLIFASEDTYYDFLRQEHTWVDELLEQKAIQEQNERELRDEHRHYEFLRQEHSWADELLEQNALEEQAKFLEEDEREPFC